MEWKKPMVILTICLVLIAFVGLLFGDNILSALQRKPTIQYQFEGAIGSDPYTYEITEELSNSSLSFGGSEVIITSQIKGIPIPNPLKIRVIDSEKKAHIIADWDDYGEDSVSIIKFQFSPRDLFEFSGVPISLITIDQHENNNLENTSGEFKLQLIQSDLSLINEVVIKVINSPWIHYVQLSDSTIGIGESIKAFITAMNYGAPSDFYISTLIYKVSDINYDTYTIDSEDWSPSKSWDKPSILLPILPLDHQISTNEAFSMTIDIPGEAFPDRGIFIVETFVLKKIPYVDITQNSNWVDDDNSYRLRSIPHYSAVIVLDTIVSTDDEISENLSEEPSESSSEETATEPTPETEEEPTPETEEEPTPKTDLELPPAAFGDYVYIDAGSFIMGSNELGIGRAPYPSHNVTLDSYYIQKFEVTNANYQLCVNDNVCAPPRDTGSANNSEYFSLEFYKDFPVINILRGDAEDYCDWVGGALPSEEYWEKAARGNKGIRYPWGNNDPVSGDSNLQYLGSQFTDPNRVGAHAHDTSPFGVLDMAGNVSEWTSSWFVSYEENNVKQFNYEGSFAVVRGGNYSSDVTSTNYAKAYNRSSYNPNIYSNTIGFRCIWIH